MKVVKAETVIKTIILNKDERIERFNSMITSMMNDFNQYSNMDRPFRLELPFAKFGNTLQDIQFVIDAGYGVYSNITDNTWIVRLFPVSTKASDEIIIPTADEIKLVIPSIGDRRKTIFKKRLEEEAAKDDPTPFQIYLDDSDFPTEADIEFIRKLGYDVEMTADKPFSWKVTLPDQKYFNGDL